MKTTRKKPTQKVRDYKSCQYKGQTYSHGAIVCQDDNELYRCNEGRHHAALPAQEGSKENEQGKIATVTQGLCEVSD